MPVLYEARDGIAFLTLNRPERLNAISMALVTHLCAALERALAAEDVALVVLRANGRAFCAGDDLKELATLEPTEAQAREFVGLLQRVTRLMMLSDKTVLCAAQGWIVGGAAAWPLNADFTLLADDAQLFCPEAGLGLFPSGGITLLLSERCGPAAASDVLWRGVRWDAAALLARQVATRVVPRAELDQATQALAAELLLLPPVSRTRLKRARAGLLRERLEQAMAYEAECCVAVALDSRVRHAARASALR
jgi:enoyl-CoA hydratase/carnithine racemase